MGKTFFLFAKKKKFKESLKKKYRYYIKKFTITSKQYNYPSLLGGLVSDTSVLRRIRRFRSNVRK